MNKKILIFIITFNIVINILGIYTSNSFTNQANFMINNISILKESIENTNNNDISIATTKSYHHIKIEAVTPDGTLVHFWHISNLTSFLIMLNLLFNLIIFLFYLLKSKQPA